MFHKSNGRDNFAEFGASTSAVALARALHRVPVLPPGPTPKAAAGAGGGAAAPGKEPPPPPPLHGLPPAGVVVDMLRREKWLRSLPVHQRAVGLPGQKGVVVNFLLQARVAREFGFPAAAGAHLLRAAPALYGRRALEAAAQRARASACYTAVPAADSEASVSSASPLAAAASAPADASGSDDAEAVALMRALPTYRTFNRSRAGAELRVGMAAPDVRLVCFDLKGISVIGGSPESGGDGDDDDDDDDDDDGGGDDDDDAGIERGRGRGLVAAVEAACRPVWIKGPLAPLSPAVGRRALRPSRLCHLARAAGREGRLLVVAAGSFT
jgi:hypothetical protein